MNRGVIRFINLEDDLVADPVLGGRHMNRTRIVEPSEASQLDTRSHSDLILYDHLLLRRLNGACKLHAYHFTWTYEA